MNYVNKAIEESRRDVAREKHVLDSVSCADNVGFLSPFGSVFYKIDDLSSQLKFVDSRRDALQSAIYLRGVSNILNSRVYWSRASDKLPSSKEALAFHETWDNMNFLSGDVALYHPSGKVKLSHISRFTHVNRLSNLEEYYKISDNCLSILDNGWGFELFDRLKGREFDLRNFYDTEDVFGVSENKDKDYSERIGKIVWGSPDSNRVYGQFLRIGGRHEDFNFYLDGNPENAVFVADISSSYGFDLNDGIAQHLFREIEARDGSLSKLLISSIVEKSRDFGKKGVVSRRSSISGKFYEKKVDHRFLCRVPGDFLVDNIYDFLIKKKSLLEDVSEKDLNSLIKVSYDALSELFNNVVYHYKGSVLRDEYNRDIDLGAVVDLAIKRERFAAEEDISKASKGLEKNYRSLVNLCGYEPAKRCLEDLLHSESLAGK